MKLKCKNCGADFNGKRGQSFCSKDCYWDSKEENIIGRWFGNIKVIGKSSKRQYRECECICGKHISRSRHCLTTLGDKQSCGCLSKGGLHISGTQFYYKFQGILSRCNDKNYKCYKNYGGKGIKCERNNVYEFYNDMYGSYIEHIKKYGEKNTTIDRIDNSKNYCKENCRWATLKEQANNKTNNVVLEYKGERLNISQWADRIGMTFSTLYQRLYKGMDLAFIIENPNIKNINEYKKINDCNNELKKYL